jgi:hypothetical protein
MRFVGSVLVLVHLVVGGWAVVGLVELVELSPPWPRLSNPELPPAVLLVHWPLMLVAAVVFVGGYWRRWRAAPTAVAVAYGCLAAVCAVETFAFLTDSGRFASMAIEYATYATILVLLFGTRLRARFTTPRAAYPADAI